MGEIPKTEVANLEKADQELFDLTAIKDSGLLWALNRFILHPQGLAMFVHLDVHLEPGTPSSLQKVKADGWGIKKSDDGIWSYDTQTDIRGRDKFLAFIEYIKTRPHLLEEELSND